MIRTADKLWRLYKDLAFKSKGVVKLIIKLLAHVNKIILLTLVSGFYSDIFKVLGYTSALEVLGY